MTVLVSRTVPHLFLMELQNLTQMNTRRGFHWGHPRCGTVYCIWQVFILKPNCFLVKTNTSSYVVLDWVIRVDHLHPNLECPHYPFESQEDNLVRSPKSDSLSGKLLPHIFMTMALRMNLLWLSHVSMSLSTIALYSLAYLLGAW